VQSISPAALLAAQAGVDGAGSFLVLVGGDDALDIVAVEDGAPIAWAWTGADIDAVKLQIDLLSAHLAATPRLVAVGVGDVLLDGLSDGTGRPLAVKLDRQVDALIAATGRRVVEGRARPWIDLRRDSLAPADRGRAYRRALNFAIASAALLLLTLAAMWTVRGVRYERAARDAESQMAAGFQREFPGWPVPANVRAVVESETRKRAQGGDAPKNQSAIASMRDVLGALPASLKVSLDAMSFDGGSFELSGRVNDQADVQVLAAAARSGGYEVPPALTRREQDGTWSFTLTGTRPQSGRTSGGAVAQQRLD
jgi:hypothetical protein